MRQFRSWYWVALVAVLLLIAMIAVALGAVSVSLGAVLDALRGRGDPTAVAIVRDLRLPRVVLGALVGAGLGASGAALQGALRNPLAEPYLLGVSGGAAVGAVVAFAFGATSDATITLAAFAGAVAAVFVALGVARVGGRSARADLRTLLIAGVIVGAFANAAIMVALANVSPNNIRGALWWMMGSAADANWQRVAWLAASILAAGGALVYWAREIDVLSLGEDTAASLGVDVERAGRRAFLLAALLAAATVSAAGLIGFVGLVVPHIARRMGLRTHRPLVLAAGVIGATLVVAADLAARTVDPPTELPLGAITALLGVPFFLVQLRRLP
ncbi:MAG TPA: iron ABC transporter permease, partial [Gemmatimonadaceae bacterium]|nr:iron ABC transporter permease [Gemmatimonadaceae bacterium]